MKNQKKYKLWYKFKCIQWYEYTLKSITKQWQAIVIRSYNGYNKTVKRPISYLSNPLFEPTQ